jgi:hypothetical protein
MLLLGMFTALFFFHTRSYLFQKSRWLQVYHTKDLELKIN